MLRDQPLARRPRLIATIVMVVPGLPVFLVGGQAVQIGDTLGLRPGTLGITVAVFFGCTALFSVFSGRVVHRWGVRRILLATLATSGISLLGLAAAQSVTELALALAVGGLANSAINPCANALLASSRAHVPLGLSLGIKQSSPAAASLAGGLAVPLVALTFGWRWSFVCAAALTLLISVAATRVAARPGDASTLGPRTAALAHRRQLVVLAIVAACGSVAGNSIGVFLDDFGVHDVKVAAGTAGFVFAIGSVGTIVARTFFGWLVDRRSGSDPIKLTAALMLSGSIGYVLIAAADRPAFVVGAILAFTLAWGWPALLHVAVVTAHPQHAARATGVLMTGFATGSFTGPLLLGQVADHVGYWLIWLLMAASCAAGGALLWLSHKPTTADATRAADALTA
jgi:MFS family permease